MPSLEKDTEMALCFVNESKRIWGNALVAKKWRDVIKRKEYDQYREKATYILLLAEKHRIYCPDIYISDNILFISYTYEKRYVVFMITVDSINYEIGSGTEEKYCSEWTNKSKMNPLSNYLYYTKKERA